MRYTRKVKRSNAGKSRKMRGGRVSVELGDDEMNRWFGNIGKLSEMSEDNLFNAFNNKKKVGVDKKNIVMMFKMMKENAKELKKEANEVSKMVNANVKTNTATLNKIMTQLKKAKNDVSKVPEKELSDEMNKWEVFDTEHDGDSDLSDEIMNRMISY